MFEELKLSEMFILDHFAESGLTIMFGSTQWELELKTVMSVMTQRTSSIGVDTKSWRIGCSCVEGVWQTLNHDLRTPINMVELGRVRRSSTPPNPTDVF